MATLPYAKQIEQAQLMVSGLKIYATEVAKRGLENEFTQELNTATEMAIALNNQQEKLKADLKAKTAELEATLQKMETMISESKKVVKLCIPQTEWKAFGMNTTR